MVTKNRNNKQKIEIQRMKSKMSLAFLWAIVTFQLNAKEITGYVKDAENKAPIPYTNIIIKGTMIGTMADESGFFRIKAADNDTLHFSSVGYYAKFIPAKSISEIPINVELTENVQQVNSAVVIKNRGRVDEKG